MRTRFTETLSLLGWLIAGLALVLAVWLWVSGTDITILNFMMTHYGNPEAQQIFGILSLLGQGGIQTLFALTVATGLYFRCRYTASRVWFMAFPVFLIVGLAGYPLKVLFGRPRPKMLRHDLYGPEWFEGAARMHSFPSGHTLTTFALLAVVVPLFKPFWRPWLWLAAAVVSFGRIGIGSHYAADVVAGAAMGYVLGVYLSRTMNLYKEQD